MPSKRKTTAAKKEAKPSLVPKLRFPEFREGEPWKEEAGSSLFDQINDRNPEPGLPVLAITQEHGAIPRHMIDYHVSVTEKSIESYKVVQVGDFIISLRSFQGGIEYSRYHGICSPAYVILRRRGGGSSEYFRHYLKTDRFIRILTKNLEGLRDGKMISYAQFSELQLPVPKPAEQQKIAECLSSVDEVIAAQARKVDALKTHKKGLMQQLFPREGETQPRLRFPEFQNAGDWEEVALSEIVEVASGQVDPKEPPYRDYPQIGSENIESNTGKLVNVKSAGEKGVISGNYLFDENDVLYSKIRPALNKAAAPDFAGICSADIYPIRPANDGLLRNYLLYLLLSDKFLEHAIRSSDRGKIPKINREDLLGYVAVIPKPAEQHRIASCLSSLDALIAAEMQKHAALQRHKRGLMQQFFPSPEEVEA
jgi:type I restriction enzyme S subunit